MSVGYPSQSQFGPSPFDQPPRRGGGSPWLISLLLIGFGVVLVGGAVCIGGFFYVAANIDRWVVTLGREAIVAAINDSELPDEDKKEVVTQVDRVVTAYKEKKINQDDLEKIFTDMEESSAFIALSFYGIEKDYLEGTDLSPKEVEQGKRSFQRAVRGLYEGKITEKDFLAALPEEEEIDIEQVNNKNFNDRVRQVANKKAQGSPDDDLRLTLAKLKNLADNARIPDEPFELHIGAEVKKLVDKHLAGK